MFFTDLSFFVFLPIVVGIYWLLPHRLQNLWLLAASYVFYSWIVPWTGLLMVAVTLLNWGGALLIERSSRRHGILIATAVLSLSTLGWFKYSKFLLENLTILFPAISFPVSLLLPAGISFFTFQALAYTIDVFRREIPAERNIITFGLFISFFPQLVAGPIERASHLLRQVRETRSCSVDQTFRGLDLLLLGYLKKVVVADNVAVYVNMIFDLQEIPLLYLFLGAIGFSIQILADFSAYTDIARGSARLMGFELVENFNHPYLAQSPSDFWRRWHMSLSSWIRDYLYIPLGGNQVSQARWVVNILIVWFLCGLWHGAGWNYILWGLYWGILIIAYRFIAIIPERRWAPLVRVPVMYCWTLIGWIIFRFHELELLPSIVSVGIPESFPRTTVAVAVATLGIFVLYASPLLIGLLIRTTPSLWRCVQNNRGLVRWVYYPLVAFIILIFAAESGEDFYYFQF